MKKFLALLLAVMMIASMSITAFAAGAETPDGDGAISQNNTGTVSVNSTVSSDETVTTIYYVVVTWKSLNFNYTVSSQEELVWDPIDHVYKTAEGDQTVNGVWSNAAENGSDDTPLVINDAIQVVNHSNTDIQVTAAFGTNDGNAVLNASNNNVTAEVVLTATDSVLENAEGYAAGTGDSLAYNVSIDGNVPSILEGFDIGTITVTIAQHNS